MRRPGPVGVRLFRCLWLLYPRAFRAAYGRELLEAFRTQARESRYRGPGGRWRFWSDILRDTVRAAAEQRWDQVTRVVWASGTGRPATARTVAGSAAARGRTETREDVVDGIRMDLAYALRSLWRSPGFAAVAVVTLALGIGANTAIFSAVQGVLLRPLPYGEPDRIATVWSRWQGFPKTWVSVPEYVNYVQRNRTFEDLALWSETSATFTDPDDPERVRAAAVTGNLLSVLRIEPALGRFFTEAEVQAADTAFTDVVLIGHGTWTRRYGADPGALGRRIDVNGRPRTLIGVMPSGFRLPTEFDDPTGAEIFFPHYVDRAGPNVVPHGGGSHSFHVAGRLAPGVEVEDAERDLDRLVEELSADGVYPRAQGFQVQVYPLAADVLGPLRPALLVLAAAVGFVLLIACANVANLLLSRSRAREGELAVRAALGAGRRRLVRQLLTESVVLAVAGGVAGVLLAHAGTGVLRALDPGNLPRMDEVAVDGSVLAFASLATLATAFLFGTLPALRAARSNVADTLGERTEVGGGRSQARWQSLLVTAEMALAVVLVVGAGLMIRTFDALTDVRHGFAEDGVVTMQVNLPQLSYPEAEPVVAFWNEALRRIGALPGVEVASAIRSRPLVDQIGDWSLTIEGYEAAQGEGVAGDWQVAAPGYPEAMGIPLVRGRTLRASDDADAPIVAMVNQAMVRAYWPNQDPIGRRFRMGHDESRPWITVVGVLGDVTHNGLTAEIKRKFYLPLAQWHVVTGDPRWSMALVVRTRDDPRSLVERIRSELRALDPTVPVAEVLTVEEILSASVAQPRFTMVLLGAFAAIAILLALVGIYGVMAYGVSQRVREIGIRMALGAREGQVVSLVVRQGLTMSGLGLVIGLIAALGLTRFLASLLYGVGATDAVTFAVVGAAFAVVAFLAAWAPALRAARIRPMVALRRE